MNLGGSSTDQACNKNGSRGEEEVVWSENGHQKKKLLSTDPTSVPQGDKIAIIIGKTSLTGNISGSDTDGIAPSPMDEARLSDIQ